MKVTPCGEDIGSNYCLDLNSGPSDCGHPCVIQL